jgi:hypothetical protein
MTTAEKLKRAIELLSEAAFELNQEFKQTQTQHAFTLITIDMGSGMYLNPSNYLAVDFMLYQSTDLQFERVGPGQEFILTSKAISEV